MMKLSTSPTSCPAASFRPQCQRLWNIQGESWPRADASVDPGHTPGRNPHFGRRGCSGYTRTSDSSLDVPTEHCVASAWDPSPKPGTA